MPETIQLRLLLATFAGRIGRRQAPVIDYLVEENRILKEQLESGEKRLRFTDDQRRRLAAKGKPLGREVLRQIATIVSLEFLDTTRCSIWHGKFGMAYSRLLGVCLRPEPIHSGFVKRRVDDLWL